MLEDPRERTNILPERTSSANAMKAALSRYATNFALPGEIDPASLERLKALGSIGKGARTWGRTFRRHSGTSRSTGTRD